jgi:phosphoribosyl 1,2-cyclic phosphodiesterase
LVDAGLPGREIARRLSAAGLEPERVEGVVVTHEHRDHISGVGVWARRFRVPVYADPVTWEAAATALPPGALRGVEVIPFEPGRPFVAAGLECLPISTSHDAAGSVGFRIRDGDRVLGFVTDLGYASGLVRDALKGAEILFLESNHDEEMLARGPYPWPLKQRIRSRHGHLSNADCAALVSELVHERLRTLVLGHLSQTNNTPRLAYDAAYGALKRRGAEEDVVLLVARQDVPGRVVAA